MNDLIQSIPSPSAYSGNYSHMDGGIMDGWWRGVGDDVAMISSNSLSQQGAIIEFSVLNQGFWLWRCSGTLSKKTSNPLDVFRSETLCRRKEGSKRWLRRPHHPLSRPRVARAARWCGPLVAHLRLVFWLRESSGKIGVLRYFPGIFRKVGFLHKNETPNQFCWKQH
jgi:hypothetical protein